MEQMAAPAPDVVVELREVLANADGRLGDTYRLWVAGINSPTEIARNDGAANAGAASTIVSTIRAILHSELTDKPSKARQSARNISTLLKTRDLSPGARRHLTAVKDRLWAVASNEAAQASEDATIEASQGELELSIKDAPGVYVYSFPTYIKHPEPPESSHVLLKVGSTKNKAWDRIKQQVRQTAMPEEPQLLRVYLTSEIDPDVTEKVFHRLLDAADHERSGGRTAGTEWFRTTLTFLDEIATALRLTIISADE